MFSSTSPNDYTVLTKSSVFRSRDGFSRHNDAIISNTPLRWPLKFEKLNDVRSLKFGPIELRSVSVKLSAVLVGTVYRTFLVMRQVAVS